jgi:hypothetical protein
MQKYILNNGSMGRGRDDWTSKYVCVFLFYLENLMCAGILPNKRIKKSFQYSMINNLIK